jgi:primosomal protein N' (replication factor Y)
MKGMERGHILMHTNKRGALQQLLKMLVSQLRSQPIAAKVRWAVDIDPLEF